MMGPEYFTVGAYIKDGEILCPECGDKAKLPVSDQITLNQLWEGFSDYAQQGGLYCECGEELIEPETPEYRLYDGVLLDSNDEVVYPEADYFATVEEAERWLEENGINATVRGDE